MSTAIIFPPSTRLRVPPHAVRRSVTSAVPRTRTTARPRATAPKFASEPSTGSAPARLTARGRAVLAVLLLLVVSGALALVLSPVAAGGSPTGSNANVAVRVTVDPGQTLWQIALTAAPGEDPRATIARIKDMNGLRSSAIEAGRVLLVPVG